VFNTSHKLLKSKICLFINVVFATWAAVFRFPNQKHFRALQTHTTQLSHRRWRFVDTLYGTVKKCLTKEICAYLVMQYAGYIIFSVYSSEKVPSKSDRTKRFPYHTNAWIYGLRFRKTSAKRSFSVIENECFGLVFAKNWVYKFGHKWIFAAESWILKSCCTFFFFLFSLMRES